MIGDELNREHNYCECKIISIGQTNDCARKQEISLKIYHKFKDFAVPERNLFSRELIFAEKKILKKIAFREN